MPPPASCPAAVYNPADVSGAVVMEQQEMDWDHAGNLLGTVTRQRLDNLADTVLGELTPSTSRTTYTASYPDAVGRTFAVAGYGTNGSTNGSGGWTRPKTVPPRSDAVLVSSTTFDTAGNPVAQTAPDSATTARTFDAADRATELVENSSGAAGTTRTTRWQYTAAGAMSRLVSENPDTGTQVTEWIHGVTIPQGSALNSNRLLRGKIYPDGSAADCVTYTYNRQGQPITMADQNGTVHAYSHDKLGVMLADTVTAFGSGVDQVVGRLEAGYNERRLQVRATSVNASGLGILNEVAWDYNGFNQPVTEWQEHGGHVTEGSPQVQYSYADGSDNTIRPTGITCPDGTTVATDYSTPQASALSRPDRIRQGGTTVASWKYLGLGTVVGRTYDAASGTESTLGTAADGYPGIDAFGRLVETLWRHGTAALVHTRYGRNRAGGIVWQRNVLAHDSSVATEDNYYWYDGLRQVTRHDRGDLTGSPYNGVDPATRQQKETFTFDQTGNWNHTTGENPPLDQGRTHNAANEITSINGPSGVIQPAYDAAGNMTVMPRPGAWDSSLACTWDAWNRLVRVCSCTGSSSSGSSGVDAFHQYDALTRRIITTTAAETRHFYFNNRWRAVEERVSGSVRCQYAWNPADRWDLILRKRSVSGTLDETRFVLRDYLDPVAIIDVSGAVTERYRYDAFGPVTVLAPDFSPRSTSACDWNFLFHAEFLDTETGLYNYGFRHYDPVLGQWLSRDPIGEQGGVNLYGFLGNDGIHDIDFLGLEGQNPQEPEAADGNRPAALRHFREIGDGAGVSNVCWECKCDGSLKIELKAPQVSVLAWLKSTNPELLRLWGEKTFSEVFGRFLDELENVRVEKEIGHAFSATEMGARKKAMDNLKDFLWLGSSIKHPVKAKPSDPVTGGGNRGYAEWSKWGERIEISIVLPKLEECFCRNSDGKVSWKDPDLD